jgi:hypothetical protein
VVKQPHQAPRGRAVLLTALGVFALVQLTASVLFDYCWPHLRFPLYEEQVYRIDKYTPKPDVIFLGSSRTACIMDETEINHVVHDVTGDAAVRCYNAGVAAGDVIVCERVLYDLLSRGARPHYVVLEVCPEGVNHRNGWLSVYTAWFLRWDDGPTFLKDLIVTQSVSRYAGTRLIPLYVYRDQIRQHVGTWAHDWFAGQPPTATAAAPAAHGDDEAPRSTVKWHELIVEAVRHPVADSTRNTTSCVDGVRRSLSDYRPGGNAAASLERLLSCCRATGIEPILVSVPLSSAHRQQYTPEIEAAFQAYMARMTRKYGCRYYDYRTAVPDAFFIDHHHAGPEGASLFSRLFALDVLAPAWSTPVAHTPDAQ